MQAITIPAPFYKTGQQINYLCATGVIHYATYRVVLQRDNTVKLDDWYYHILWDDPQGFADDWAISEISLKNARCGHD